MRLKTAMLEQSFKTIISRSHDKLISFLKESRCCDNLLQIILIEWVSRGHFHKLLIEECDIPVVSHQSYNEDKAEDIQIKGGVDFGTIY